MMDSGGSVTCGPADLPVKDLLEPLVVVQLGHPVEIHLLPEEVYALGLAVDLVQQLAGQIRQFSSGGLDDLEVLNLIDLQVEYGEHAFYAIAHPRGDIG